MNGEKPKGGTLLLAGNPDFPTPTSIPWSCPGCATVWITPDLQPRCSICGFLRTDPDAG